MEPYPDGISDVPARTFADLLPVPGQVALLVFVAALLAFTFTWQLQHRSKWSTRVLFASVALLGPIVLQSRALEVAIRGLADATKDGQLAGQVRGLRVSRDVTSGRGLSHTAGVFAIPVKIEGLPSGVNIRANCITRISPGGEWDRTDLVKEEDGYWLRIATHQDKSISRLETRLWLRLFTVQRAKVAPAGRAGAFSPAEGFACHSVEGGFECWHEPEFQAREQLLMTPYSLSDSKNWEDVYFDERSALSLGFSPVRSQRDSMSNNGHAEKLQFWTAMLVETVEQTLRADAVDFAR